MTSKPPLQAVQHIAALHPSHTMKGSERRRVIISFTMQTRWRKVFLSFRKSPVPQYLFYTLRVCTVCKCSIVSLYIDGLGIL